MSATWTSNPPATPAMGDRMSIADRIRWMAYAANANVAGYSHELRALLGGRSSSIPL